MLQTLSDIPVTWKVSVLAVFVSAINTILSLMCKYIYELSLYKTPPSWLQWSLVTVITPVAVSKSNVLVLCVLNLFHLNGSLWFLKVCYLLCITRGYSNGWRQWRFHCIISLVVDIAWLYGVRNEGVGFVTIAYLSYSVFWRYFNWFR